MPYASNIANSVLYTPLDSNAVIDNTIAEQLGYNEFIKNCYVLPQFKSKAKFNATDDNLESYDYVVNCDHIINLRNRQKNDYNNFEKWLLEEQNNKIYTISGNAGTGKTTFIHRLKYEHPDKNWIIFDIAKSQDFIDWFNGIQTDIEDFCLPYNKMTSIVLKQLHTLLFDCANQKQVDYAVLKLNNMMAVYSKKFGNVFVRGMDYFNKIFEVVADSSRTNTDIITQSALITKDYFCVSRTDSDNAAKKYFRKAMDVLLIACCLTDDDPCVFVFDNFERFVSHDEIYNKDVDLIRRDLASYARDVYEKSQHYKVTFKFIMGMRSSSSRMCGVKLHSADELPSNLDLTDWFMLDEIANAKISWYKEHKVKIENIDLLMQILSDLRICSGQELTGLKLFINPLFNDNIRLIIDFIGIVIEKTTNAPYIQRYQELWNENTSVSRFAARSIMRGLIYQELDLNDNLFRHLQLYSKESEKDPDRVNYGLSYTRKILTILYNNINNDVTLEQVIAKICNIKQGVQEYWNDTLDDTCKNDICEVLYYMNSYNRRENDWIQFVDLQITGKMQNVAIDDVASLKELIDNSLNSISLRIMPAGETYIRYIVNSYEFFSFRFYKKHMTYYCPLFSAVPSREDLLKCSSVKELTCWKIMNYVKENALKCIDNIEKKGDIQVIIINNISKKHIERIIYHHQGYIDKFVSYIRKKYAEGYDIKDKLKSLLDECILIRNEYNIYLN